MKQNNLVLPNGRFVFTNPLPEKKLLMVAGGRPPARDWLTHMAAQMPVWCVDGGVDCCREWGIIPERIIGDGDSATKGGWMWGQALGVPMEIYSAEKNLTDLQLALQRAGELYQDAVVIVSGVWGGRFDHTFSNIYSLLGSAAFGLQCCAADETEALVFLQDRSKVQITVTVKPEIISLLPLSACAGVSINGVHWPLDKVELQPALPYAVSNRLAAELAEVSVEVASGSLGVYLCWNQKKLVAK